MRPASAIPTAAIVLLLLATGAGTASAHPVDAAADDAPVTAKAVAPEITDPGPCTAAAAQGMPEGEGHDHQNIEQHRNLSCRMKQVAFDSLKDELKDRPDVVLGEMDVKADIAAVSVIYPEGGILFFDVADPANPKFLSWYRDANCESTAIANNCGAFVDLSADGKTAIIGVQNLTLVPFPTEIDTDGRPTAQPGVQIVDITDPKKPARGPNYTVISEGGVHTARTFRQPEGPAKGEYVYAIANGLGVDISRFEPSPGVAGGRTLRNVARIDAPNVHDTFTQVDPIDGKTYLYLADGYGSGFQVFDVTAPASPKRVAVWDLTPQCTRDWYSHTIDVTHRGDRRYVTLPAELFTSGTQSEDQQKLGCGKVRGNGDKPGPMWIVDASDFSKLPQAGQPTADVKKGSEAALVTTWTNPAGRAAGNLTFSPHNQQIVGDKIYLSDYHGGVFVLDASGAFAGRSERPRELAYMVPSGEASNEAARPLFKPDPGSATPRMRGRSSIWDMVFYKGHVLAADQVGGFYSLQDGDAAAERAPAPATADPTPRPGTDRPAEPACADRLAPRARFPRRGGLRITRRGLKLQGTALDLGCGGRVARVEVAVAKLEGKRCRFVTARGKLTRPRSCSRASYLRASGTDRWQLRLAAKLPRGRYRATPRGIDAAGNVQRRGPRFKRVR